MVHPIHGIDVKADDAKRSWYGVGAFCGIHTFAFPSTIEGHIGMQVLLKGRKWSGVFVVQISVDIVGH